MRGVDKTQRNTIISGFTLRSVFVKAITGVRHSLFFILWTLDDSILCIMIVISYCDMIYQFQYFSHSSLHD